MEAPLPQTSVAGGAPAFSPLPFLTDAYLPAPHSAAAVQQQQQHFLPLQGNSPDQVSAGAAAESLGTAAADGWLDPNKAAALHLLGGPRDADPGDLLCAGQDPAAVASSCINSYFCSPFNFSVDNPQAPLGGPCSLPMDPQSGVSCSFMAASVAGGSETGSNNFLGIVPSGGLPLYGGTPLPFGGTYPLGCGVAGYGGPLGSSGNGTPQQEQGVAGDSRSVVREYSRLTRQLGRECAFLKELVNHLPASVGGLNSVLDSALQSADKITILQGELLLSANQQHHLVAESKLICSKVLLLSRILDKTTPKYGQLLQQHPALREYLQQVERNYCDTEESENLQNHLFNCSNVRRRRRSSSCCSKRRSTRQYKRQQASLMPESARSFLAPAVKCERPS